MSQMRAGLVGIVAGTEQVVLQMTAEGGNRRGVPVCDCVYAQGAAGYSVGQHGCQQRHGRHSRRRRRPVRAESRGDVWIQPDCAHIELVRIPTESASGRCQGRYALSTTVWVSAVVMSTHTSTLQSFS